MIVKYINEVAAGSSFPSNLTGVGTTLFIRASDGANGSELWNSDGTAAGAELVKDIIVITEAGSNPLILNE